MKLTLQPSFDLNRFQLAIKKLMKTYPIRINCTNRKTPFAAEICYHISDNILHFYLNHKYYDGKVLSHLSHQLDLLYNNINAVIKPEFFFQINTTLRKEIMLQLYNKHTSTKARLPKKIFDFYDPLSITNVINYIKQRECKTILMLKADKGTASSTGENFKTIIIRKNQAFGDAMANPEEFTMKKLPFLVPVVIVNFYTKFHQMSFCTDFIFDTNVLSLTSVAQLLKGDFYTLYPKTSSGSYPLYLG